LTRPRRLIVCADDFGLDEAVNEAVEEASLKGVLTCASLMVGAPACADAVRRAKSLPNLAVGLHVTLVDGRPVLPPEEVPALVQGSGAFDDRMALAGARIFFSPAARAQAAAEIRAQFEAFAATGLPLDHVNAHKHFHLHPTLARLIIEIGRDYGMRAMRVPLEPPGRQLHAPFAKHLRTRARAAGIAVNDHLLGLAWSGAMTEARMLALVAALPEGVSELYCHPASRATAALTRTMPDYRHTEELAALLSARLRAQIERAGIELTTFGRLQG